MTGEREWGRFDVSVPVGALGDAVKVCDGIFFLQPNFRVFMRPATVVLTDESTEDGFVLRARLVAP